MKEKKFTIKDENNNIYTIIKDNENMYNFVIDYKKSNILKYDENGKIAFNQELNKIKHNGKLNVEIINMFFNKNYLVNTKRELDSTYVKITSFCSYFEPIHIGIVVYDSEFENMDFNEFFTYHLHLVNALHNSFIKMVDFRSHFKFKLSYSKIIKINELMNNSNLTTQETLKIINEIKNNDEECDFFNQENN